MLPSRYPALALAFLLSALPFIRVAAQMQPHARLDDEMLPIVGCSDKDLTVLRNGKKNRTRDLNFEIRRGPGFAEGFIHISDIVADTDPLRDAPLKERTHPSAVRFRYTAKLTADRSLDDCYGLLTFIAQGSIQRKLVPIGDLSARKTKEIEVELRSPIDAPGSIHLFSKSLEVRTNEHPDTYDVQAFYADLLKNVKGIAAAELVKFDDVNPHELSADGRYLATVRKRAANKELIVYDLSSMKLLCQVPVAEADDFVGHLTWISDQEVAYVAEDDFQDTRSEYRLNLLDVSSSKTKSLSNDVFSIITALPDQRHVLVVRGGRYADSFYKYDVRTGKTSDLEDPAFGFYQFDRNGTARIRMRVEKDRFEFFCRPTPDSSWRRVDDLVKQPDLRFDYRAADRLDRVADIHSIGSDGDTLYISTRLGTDRWELAAFSMSEGIIKKTIARHPRYDLTEGDGGMARLLFAKESTRLLGLIFETQKPQVVWLDPNYQAAQQAMNKSFPDHFNLPIDWSEDGSTFIFLTTNDRDPGTFYVFRSTENRLIAVLELGAHLKDRSLARTTPAEFPTRDGQKIYGYVTRPPELDGPAPLLVNVHGGPMARDGWHFDATNQFFATRGYIVLQVNYRGSSGYGAAYQNAGLLARLDTVIIDDIADAVRHLIDQGEVDASRVAITGASFGGWATYISLAKYPELYRAGIAVAAVSSWRKTLRDDRWVFDNQVAYRFWKTLLQRESFKADEPFIDPLLRSAEIKQPVFIVHGERDPIVHATEARQMLNALRKHNPNIQAKSFPLGGHGNWSIDDRVIYLNEMGAFLDRHLPPAAATVATR